MTDKARPPIWATRLGAGKSLKKFGPPLDLAAAANAGSYTLTSKDDGNYANARNAHARPFARPRSTEPPSNWPEPPYTLEHTIYLKLPQKLQQGKHYTLKHRPRPPTPT